MRVNANKPKLMPPEYWTEFDSLSKAALMDIAWDYATRTVGEGEGAWEPIVYELRATAHTINSIRRS